MERLKNRIKYLALLFLQHQKKEIEDIGYIAIDLSSFKRSEYDPNTSKITISVDYLSEIDKTFKSLCKEFGIVDSKFCEAQQFSEDTCTVDVESAEGQSPDATVIVKNNQLFRSESDAFLSYALSFILFHELSHLMYDKDTPFPAEKEIKADEVAFKAIINLFNEDELLRNCGVIVAIMQLLSQKEDETKKDVYSSPQNRVKTFIDCLNADAVTENSIVSWLVDNIKKLEQAKTSKNNVMSSVQ